MQDLRGETPAAKLRGLKPNAERCGSTNRDGDAVIVEDEAGVGAGELAGRHGGD
jgi:hypothetical protein